MTDAFSVTTAWFLITITGTGVTSSVQLPDKSSCETVRSLALTGMTPEDDAALTKKNDAAEIEAQKKIDADKKEWTDAHPTRQPRDDAERAAVKECEEHAALNDNGAREVSLMISSPNFEITPTCVVQDVRPPPLTSVMFNPTTYDPAAQFTVLVGGRSVIKPRAEIEYAYCIAPTASAP